MEGRQHDLQEEAKFRVRRLVSQSPNIYTRGLANAVGISNKTAFYLIKALIKKRFVKFKNFCAYSHKSNYTYILAPKAIKEKSKLTFHFFERMHYKFYKLKHEIKEVEIEASLTQEGNKL